MAKAFFKGKSGNDYAVYDVGAHAYDDALYDGGSGTDTLELRMTRAEFDLARADILRYLDFIADRTHGNGQASGRTFGFRAFDLDVKHFEQLVVRVDGHVIDPRDPDNPVDAVDDAAQLAANATLIGSVTGNDSAPDVPSQVTLVNGPALGTLQLAANGSYTYDPGAAFATLLRGESAVQTFTYRLTDVDGDSDTATVTLTIDGAASRALDGYIAGATVFADANGNGTLDAGEASAITGASGEFVLNSPGTLILRGGIDVATALPFTGELRAPEGYGVVTALTTLVSVLAASGLTVEESESKVRSAFGIDVATELGTLDPIAQTLAGNANAAAAFVAGSAVLNSVTMLASVVHGANEDVDFAQAATDAFLSLAQSIDALGAGVLIDLSDPTTVSGLAVGAGVPPHLLDGTVEIVAQSNAVLTEAAQALGGAALLADATRIAIVAQDEAAGALEHAGATGDVSQALAAFTGEALDERVSSQDAGDVDGSGVQNAPIASDDIFAAIARAGLSIDTSALLANDVDYDGDALSASIVEGPVHGTLVANGAAYVYTPDPGFVGTDSFTYSASDGPFTSNVATVTLQVDTTNRAPTAVSLGPAGALDATFGDGGVLSTDITWTDAPRTMVVLGDGRIVVAAATQDLEGHTSYALARYHADGTLDTAFGDGGIVLEPLAGEFFVEEVPAAKLAVHADGGIVLATTTTAGDVAVFRYASDGARDTRFDGDGALVTDLGAEETVGGVAFDADGRVLIAGATGNSALLARYATDGSLDATLGGDGVVTWARPFTPSGILLRSIASANDLAVLEDGRILLAGGSGIFERSFGAYMDLTLIRYNADGTLDETFGSGGVALDFIGVRSPGFPSNSAARSVAIGRDGDIAVAATVDSRAGLGISRTRFGIGHYDSDGDRIATTLTVIEERDANGKPTLQGSQAHDVAFDSHGRIIAAGTSGPGVHLALARYNGDLSLDTSFAGDGRALLAPVLTQADRVSLGIQPDGRVVALVSADNGVNGDLALVRVLPGELHAVANENEPFSKTLIATIFSDPDGDALAFSATRADGSPLPAWLSFDGATLTLSGTPGDGDEGVLDVRVVASDGALDADVPLHITVVNTNDAPVVQRAALDSHFGVGGRTPALPAEWSSAFAVGIHGDGIVVSGHASIDGVGRPLLARYDAAGALDASFGENGVVYTDFDSALLAVDADGRIVVVDSTAQDFVLARYNADGSPDTEFGDNGRVANDFGDEEVVHAISVAPDGSIVAAGFQRDGFALDFAIARYAASGALDPGFGTGGFEALHVDDRVATTVALQSDGRIVIGANITDADVMLLRLAADGSLDPTFGTGGVAVAAPGFVPGASQLLIDSDGSILLAGSVFTDSSAPAVARFDSSGGLDATFGDSGIATGILSGATTSAVLQPDDSIVVAAQRDFDDGTALTITRYDAAGHIDRSLTLAFDQFVYPAGLALQADGGLIAGATVNNGVDLGAMGLARVLLDIELSDVTARAGEAFAATVPVELFGDPDGDPLTYSAVLSDGSALPAWLGFDPGSITFSGTPSAEDAQTLAISVRAGDPFGLFATETFMLNVLL